MNQHNPNTNHDDLDRLIRAALAEEPSPEQLRRLENFWAKSSRVECRRRWSRRLAGPMVAVAVVVLLAVGLTLVFRQPPRQAGQGGPTAKIEDAPEGPSLACQLSAGRAPTVYEQAIFVMRTRKPAIASCSKEVASKTNTSKENAPKTGATGCLSASAGLTIDPSPEKYISTNPLLPVEQLPRQLAKTNDPRQRADILRQLLDADSEPSLNYYLTLVHNESTRAEALAVAEKVPDPTRKRLLALLEHDDRPVRFAAALVLGHSNGPQVTDALIKLIRRKRPPGERCPTEAWVALIQCRGDQAEAFIAYVSHHPTKYRNQFNRARMMVQMAMM